jgi:hypothetical protein
MPFCAAVAYGACCAALTRPKPPYRQRVRLVRQRQTIADGDHDGQYPTIFVLGDVASANRSCVRIVRPVVDHAATPHTLSIANNPPPRSDRRQQS